ncbi:MAG TPA: DinB family protein [Chloroflexi bacterium]|nr:DinB family protein [Chloroflexota bacterium]
MLDFTPVREKTLTMAELCAGLTVADLRALTNEMVDAMLALIANCTDTDVVFQPVDPAADDPFAANAEEANLAWTLGHVIVHTTASAEEAAFLAAEMARGVPNHGRSRYETPWEQVTTIAQCRQRLEESRRMRLATLDMWPDAPHVEVTYSPWRSAGEINCVARFVLGLRHDDDHLEQIADIVRQACSARVPA